MIIFIFTKKSMDLFDDIVGKFFLDDRNDGVIVPLCKGDEGGSKITV